VFDTKKQNSKRMSESESESERKATGAPTAPATDTTADEAAQEELDWGSIDDDDGAFGQIQADSGVSDEGELNLGGRADAEDGKEWSGIGAALMLKMARSGAALGLQIHQPAPAPCWARLMTECLALGAVRKLRRAMGMAV
jgi:hypothetical protein